MRGWLAVIPVLVVFFSGCIGGGDKGASTTVAEITTTTAVDATTTSILPTTTTTTGASTTTTSTSTTTTVASTTLATSTSTTLNPEGFMERLSRCGYVKNEADRNDCYSKAALEYNNPLGCDKVSVIVEEYNDRVNIKPCQRDNCYTTLAITLGNASLCNNASNIGNYSEYAEQYTSRPVPVYIMGNPQAYEFCCVNVTGSKCTTTAPTTAYTTTTQFASSSTTTTTVPAIMCSSDADCGGTFESKRCAKEPGKDECIITEQFSFVCKKPGTLDAICLQLQPQLLSKEYCSPDEVCLNKACYPDYCANQIRDVDLGEEKIDCGGPCPNCTEKSIACASDYDCERPLSDKHCDYINSRTWVVQDYMNYTCVDRNTTNSSCVSTNKEFSLRAEYCGQACDSINGNAVCTDTPSGFPENEKYLLEYDRCGENTKQECTYGLTCCEERNNKCVYNCP